MSFGFITNTYEGNAGDAYGQSVAVSNNFFAVGSTGYNHNFSNDGAVYLYDIDNNLLNTLYISGGFAGENNAGFGRSLAFSDDEQYLFVGVNGDSGSRGSVQVFQKDFPASNSWGFKTEFVAPIRQAGRNFGWSVSSSGNYVVIGENYNSGVAQVHLFNYLTGTHLLQIGNPSGQHNSNFGSSISIDSTNIIIGAYSESQGASASVGKVYVYNTSGSLIKELVSPSRDEDYDFGSSVSISGDTVVVGEPQSLAGLDGKIHLYRKDEGGINNWGRINSINYPGSGSIVGFGKSVFIDDNFIMAGAWLDNSAYIFEKNSNYLKELAPSEGTSSKFGLSLASKGDIFIVGDPFATVTTSTGQVHMFDKLEGAPSTFELTLQISSGEGFLNSSCLTCDAFDLASLVSSPDAGFRVKKWTNTNDDRTISNQNDVYMTEDKTIYVSFETIPGLSVAFEGTSLALENIFYCPSKEIESNIITFTYNNDTGSSQDVYFKIDFYADPYRNKLVYSAFSYSDIKRWFIEPLATPITLSGVTVEDGEVLDITYAPEILPQILTERQRKYDIDGSLIEEYEFPLLQGVKYYLDIQSFTDDSSAFGLLDSFTFSFPSSNVSKNFWREDEDSKNWISSGQKKTDLKVTKSNSQTLFPSISSNEFGHFMIAWQDFRNPVFQVNTAIWESEIDELQSSGQGFFDRKFLPNAYTPLVLTDQAQNFYVAGKSNDGELISYNNSLPITVVKDQELESENILCFPGLGTNLDLGQDNIRVRVYNEDTNGSLVISNENVISVVEKTDVRLDIEGIPGAYAIRLRNNEDDDFSDWINIDTELTTTEGIDAVLDAYFIDNDRFLVPWVLPRTNGIRRVCCQVLTFYGITETFCINMLLNLDELAYGVEFFTDANMDNISPQYDGKFVISKAEGDTIYIRVTFNTNEDLGDMTFNIIQQGTNDLFGLPLIKIENGVYTGSFPVEKEDGIFNKDGDAIIIVNIPNQILNLNVTFAPEDLTGGDPFNLLQSFLNKPEIRTQSSSSSPEGVFELISTSKFNRVLNVNSLKNTYNKDDKKFRFGNPEHYIK